MYLSLRGGAPEVAERGPEARRRWSGVGGNVVFLGLTSLFTDISSEMVNAVLPLYLVAFLGMTPLHFGFIDGIYQGVTALVRIAGGYVADRRWWHKQVAATGYGISAVCKLGLLAAGGAWTALAAVVALDRAGKGIRTGPRDALISLSTARPALGRAFGLHRALDTTGAMLGPLVAFWLLARSPDAFDSVFVVSFCTALVGLGVLVLFVQNRTPTAASASGDRSVSLRAATGLLRGPRFRTLVIAGSVLALTTVSDGFVYLTLQRKLDLATGMFPLLYVGTSLVYLLLAVPLGHLADRVGRGRVFLAGHVMLLGVYAVVLRPEPGMGGLVVALALLGVKYAATDGVLMALASVAVPEHLRSSGLAVVTTATAAAGLLASVLFGGLWTWWGVDAAVLLFAVGLVAALAITARALADAPEEARP